MTRNLAGRRRTTRAFAIFVTIWLLAATSSRPARALDKQGSAHGGDVAGADHGFDLTGALTVGVSIINNSYAARPNNTGLTLMRYAGHADVDIIGRRLSFPVDVNMFTDKLEPGFKKLVPTELDYIVGMTSTWKLGYGASETGVRFEHDQPFLLQPPDVPKQTQAYVDIRERYLYSLAQRFPGLADALRDGDVSGWLTLGWFAYNPNQSPYYARPNNTGRALFRYGVNLQVSTFSDFVSFGIDATMFTDKFAPDPLRPSELDLTPEVIFHRADWELHVAYESDRPLDQNTLKQQFVYLLLVWSFDAYNPKPPPFEQRSHVPSP